MNFTMNESAIKEAERQMQAAKESLENGYTKLLELTNRLETVGTWEGETQKAFIAYLDLVRQYHQSFTDENENNPVMYAVTAFTEFLERAETFHEEYVNYKYLEEIG